VEIGKKLREKFMSKIILSVAAAILMAAPASAAVIIVAGDPVSLAVIEHATSDATASIGKAKDNRGDILTFANPIFDKADKKQVGTDNGYCIRTVVGAAYECTFITMLAGGQITVEGPFHDSGDTTLAVTGGTGRYLGVKGQMTLHARDAKGSAFDFRYTFVK
jgi:allene oxide cyclase